MKLSLCCISEELSDKDVSFQTMTLKRFFSLERKYAEKVLSERILNNFIVTRETIRHCYRKGIAGYRLSSSLTPVISHPEVNLRLEQLADWARMKEVLDETAAEIKQFGIRISAHPSEYITLTSENPEAIKNSVTDLVGHAELFDLLGLERSHWNPMNIHCRQDGDPSVISERFLKTFFSLPDSVKSRLTIEVNDNKDGTWNLSNLFKYFFSTAGIPIVYDSLHRVFCNDGATDQEDFFLACSTWNKTPLFHYSEGVDGTRKHADMPLGVPESYGRDVYFDVELKAKDKAIYVIQNKLQNL